MTKYLVEYSRKSGSFRPFIHERKYYIVSCERLVKMLNNPVCGVVWSSRWVYLEPGTFENLQAIYGKIEIID